VGCTGKLEILVRGAVGQTGGGLKTRPDDRQKGKFRHRLTEEGESLLQGRGEEKSKKKKKTSSKKNVAKRTTGIGTTPAKSWVVLANRGMHDVWQQRCIGMAGGREVGIGKEGNSR